MKKDFFLKVSCDVPDLSKDLEFDVQLDDHNTTHHCDVEMVIRMIPPATPVPIVQTTLLTTAMRHLNEEERVVLIEDLIKRTPTANK